MEDDLTFGLEARDIVTRLSKDIWLYSEQSSSDCQ